MSRVKRGVTSHAKHKKVYKAAKGFSGRRKNTIRAAKAAVEFAKTNDKLEIVGGAMGSTQLDAAGIKALASMPSLDELRAKIVGLVNAPATKVAQLVNAPASKLARVFGAYGAKEAA